MNQLLLGMSIPFAVGAILYVRGGCRATLRLLLVTPLAMLSGAIVAVAPDLPRLTGRLDLYHRLARDTRTDVFLWHRSIDLMEGECLAYTIGIVLLLAALLAAAWRELRREEEV